MIRATGAVLIALALLYFWSALLDCGGILWRADIVTATPPRSDLKISIIGGAR